MEPSNNTTETEDETIALRRKRARRVSFADNEITSVHIFRRDDDSSSSDAHSNSTLGFFRDFAGDSDDDQPQDLNDADARDSFLRPIGFPSPGGSSTTADDVDGDDFHGPVTAGFIRPERLSDSGASDDVTMDSTAFSLHYRSLARSDSGDLKTPTRFGSTSSAGTCSPPGSYMELTKAKTPTPCEVPAGGLSGGRDSNDMSIVGEHPLSYDYDKLSPSLEAILAEGSKDLAPNSPFRSKALSSPKTDGASIMETESPRKLEIQAHESSVKEIKEFVKDVTVSACGELVFANANRGTPLRMGEVYQLNLSGQCELGYSKGQCNDSNPKDKGQVCSSNHKSDLANGNPIHGLTPSSVSARKQLFLGSPGSSRYIGNITSPIKKSGSFVPEAYVARGTALSSTHNSISKLKLLETTPSRSTLKEGLCRLKSMLSKYSPGTSLFNEKDCEYKQVETLNTPLERQLFSLTLENNVRQGLINVDAHGTEYFRKVSKFNQIEETVDTKTDEENFNLIYADISCKDKNYKSVGISASPLQMNCLRREVDFDLADSTVEKRNDEILIVAHDKPISSPVKLFDQNSSLSIECQSNCHGELRQVDKQNESVNGGLGEAIECKSLSVANRLELSGFENSEQHSSPFEVAEISRFPESATKEKPAESPSSRVIVLSTSIQEETNQLPTVQEPPSELLHSNMQDLSHNGYSYGHGLDSNYCPVLQVAQSPLTKSGIDVSSGKKRKDVEILSEGDNINKIGGIGRSPEVHKSVNGDLQLVLEQTDYTRSEIEKLGDQTRNDWDNILKEFLSRTKWLLSPCVDKLNLRSIGMLEDILVHQQKIIKWEILCSEIHSQRIGDHLNNFRHQRALETRVLLLNIAYQKAKLLFLHMKRERLQERVQQLSSGLQECEMLKLNLIPCSSKIRAIDAQADYSPIRSRLFNSQGKCQVACKKVLEMRQELEALDLKAKSICEFLYSHCEMERDRSCASTIKSVHGYLQKRMTCKFIFQNLKLWDIENFEQKDGCHTVVLNYCGYIIQRFTANTCPSSIIISNKLNDEKIGKAFSDTDAYSAFVFVLNSHTTNKRSGSISFKQETQLTSSLLSNLLDVVEEVQLARIEIRNLVRAKFYSPSVQQLDLQLSFVDFSSGRKVKVTLDLRCLKCGVYPAEVLPSQIFASVEQKYLPLSFVDEIRSAAESARAGYSRIIRLCRCISQVVQACTPSG